MLWYKNLAETIRKNMDQLKTAFVAKFDSVNNIFHVGLLRIKQEEDESGDDFFVRMETQIRDTVIPENILVGMVIQALKELEKRSLRHCTL